MKSQLKLSALVLIICMLFHHASNVKGSDCAQYKAEPPLNNFVLVIDRSGSMQGKALSEAKSAAETFIDQMKKQDKAQLIVFGSDVQVLTSMTENKNRLTNQIYHIQASGQTALYDAIAKSIGSLHNLPGAKTIVFLTDGRDNQSQFQFHDIQKMNISEGIFVYGIGLGNVDVQGLSQLSKATEGDFQVADNSTMLKDLYSRVLNRYYSEYGDRMASTASVTIRSVPSGQSVHINSQQVGRTPISMSGLKVQQYNVEVSFPRGSWECNVQGKPGYRALIDARESDLGYRLDISTQPGGSAIFVDGAYVGMTPVFQRDSRGSSIPGYQQDALKVPLLPAGTHTLRVMAIPDFDFGPEQNFEFEFQIHKDRTLRVEIFNRKAVFGNGEIIQSNPFEMFNKGDPFEELDNLK